MNSCVVTTYDSFRHYEATLRALGIPLFSLHHGDLTLRNRAQALRRYVRLMASLHPQIVHSWLHYPNLIAGTAKPVCPSHKLITSTREVLTPHARRSEKVLCQLSDFRIVNYQIQDPLKPPKNKRRHATIPNAIDLDKYNPNCLLTPTDSHFNLLMPARIDPRKDHETLINAIAQLPLNVRNILKITLIGEVTSRETQRKLEQSIKNLKLNDIIQQLPPVNDLGKHYINAHAIILPSRSEGAPNVILESFAAGRPVIASVAANQAGFITEGINGWLFPTGDSQSLARLLEQVIKTSPAKLQQMGEQARHEAEKYPISRMINAYEDIYEHLLSD